MKLLRIISTIAVLLSAAVSSAQNIRPGVGERITITGGIAETAVENKAGVELGAMTPDSLYRYMSAIDSLRGDGIRFNRAETDSLVTSLIDRTSPTGDTLSGEEMAELIALRKTLTLNSSTVRRFLDDRAFTSRYLDGGVDTLLPKLIPPDTLSRRQKRLLARRDTTAYRYNNIFRDSIKLSPMIAISMVVPGFSQFYNEDYWKIPILYGTVAAGVGLFAWQNKQYKPYKRAYDYYYDRRIDEGSPGYDRYKATMVDLQSNMIRHNTYRQLAIGLAAASYIYFLVDGTLNYSGTVDHVKKATTLATICPGAGQVYNKTAHSYRGRGGSDILCRLEQSRLSTISEGFQCCDGRQRRHHCRGRFGNNDTGRPANDEKQLPAESRPLLHPDGTFLSCSVDRRTRHGAHEDIRYFG